MIKKKLLPMFFEMIRFEKRNKCVTKKCKGCVDGVTARGIGERVQISV